MAIIFQCPGCGRRLLVPDDCRGQKAKCPECGTVRMLPAAAEEGSGRQAVPVRAAACRPEPAGAPEGGGYAVVEDGSPCPKCLIILPPRAVLCIRCGFDQRTGRKREAAAEPVDRRWDVGLSFPWRLGICIALGCLFPLIGALRGDLVVALGLTFSGPVLAALLLGTYIKLRLVRSARGKVLLTKTWCFCFIPTWGRQVNVRRFDRLVIESRITSGGARLSGMVWMVLLLGALGGRFFMFRRYSGTEPYGVYTVVLERAGTDECFTLFWRPDSNQMRDIVDTLSESAGLEITRR
jgi:hypothetical protein